MRYCSSCDEMVGEGHECRIYQPPVLPVISTKTYDAVLSKLEQFKARQIKFRRPNDLTHALIFALKRHDGHGDCKTVTGVAQILGVEWP